MEQFLGKKYILTESENFDSYLAHIGVGYIGRKAAQALSPVLTITRNDDGTYGYNVKTALFSWEVVFIPGVEYDEKRPDGKTVRALIIMEGNVLTHTQVHAEGKQAKHVMEFQPDKMVVTTIVEGLNKTVKRYYKLVE